MCAFPNCFIHQPLRSQKPKLLADFPIWPWTLQISLSTKSLIHLYGPQFYFLERNQWKKKRKTEKAPFLHGTFISSKIYGNPLKTAVYFFAGHKFIDKKTSRQTYGLLEVPSTFSVQFLDVVCARWVIECHLYTRCHFMNERHIMNGLVELSCAAYYIAVRRKSDW